MNIKSRKFIMSVSILLLATLLLAVKLLDADNWVTIAVATLATYGAGNVGEHFANRGRSSG